MSLYAELSKKNIDTIIPIETYIKSNTKILHRCLICKYEWNIKPNNVLSGYGCPSCAGNTVIKGKNSLWDTNPKIASLLKNNEDGYKYAKFSAAKVDWICPECNAIVKNRSISNVTQQRLRYDKCSDGVSIPNKMMANMLELLNVKYETEAKFAWSNGKLYDFYLPDLNAIIEMHGGFHYIDSQFTTANKVQENDRFKKDIALNNKIKHYIEIDASNSSLGWLTESIVNSTVSKLLNLSEVDWELCHERSLKSLIIIAVTLWNQGESTLKISKSLKLAKNTIIDYLHKADSIGLCNYKGVSNRFKKVVCLTTMEIFDSIKEASNKYSSSSKSHIGGCCRGERNYSGKLASGERLRWAYYDNVLIGGVQYAG